MYTFVAMLHDEVFNLTTFSGNTIDEALQNFYNQLCADTTDVLTQSRRVAAMTLHYNYIDVTNLNTPLDALIEASKRQIIWEPCDFSSFQRMFGYAQCNHWARYKKQMLKAALYSTTSSDSLKLNSTY